MLPLILLMVLSQAPEQINLTIILNETNEDPHSRLIRRCLKDDIQFYLADVLGQPNLKDQNSIKREFYKCQSKISAIKAGCNLIWKTEIDAPYIDLPAYSFNDRDAITFGRFCTEIVQIDCGAPTIEPYLIDKKIISDVDIIWERPYNLLEHILYLIRLKELVNNFIYAVNINKDYNLFLYGEPFLEWHIYSKYDGGVGDNYVRYTTTKQLKPSIEPFPWCFNGYSQKIMISDSRSVLNEFNVVEEQEYIRKYELTHKTVNRLLKLMDMGTGELKDFIKQTEQTQY